MKFKDGYMISSGQPVIECIDSAVKHVLPRQVCFVKACPFFVEFYCSIRNDKFLSAALCSLVLIGSAWNQG